MSIFRSRIEQLTRCYSCCGGGGGSAPSPDPKVGLSMEANAQLARDIFDFGKTEYEANRPNVAAAQATAQKVSDQQLAAMTTNQQHADAQWERLTKTFQPVEDQTVSDAMTIDNAGALDKAAGDASAGVQKQFDNAQEQRRRAQAASGINPNSGRALAADAETQLALAATKAGSATNARVGARDRGIAARAGVANFGRNMPNTAANSYGISTAAGNSSAVNAASIPALSTAATAPVFQGANSAISANNSVGSMGNAQYGIQMQGYQADQAASASGSSGVGQLFGTLAAPLLMKSSKKLKDHKTPIDHGSTLEKVEGLPVENWQYKKGVSDEGQHQGPYAEDVQKSFGNKAAPGGKAIDMVSMNGIALSAIKGLSAKVDKLDGKVTKIAASRGISKRS